MKKSELISTISKIYPFLKNNQVVDIIDFVFAELTCGLKNNRRVEIRGFGSFLARKRKVQLNFPNSTEVTAFKERKSVYFRLGKEFFDRLND